MTGPNVLQGPHQSAWKSTTISRPGLAMKDSNSAAVRSRTVGPVGALSEGATLAVAESLALSTRALALSQDGVTRPSGRRIKRRAFMVIGA